MPPVVHGLLALACAWTCAKAQILLNPTAGGVLAAKAEEDGSGPPTIDVSFSAGGTAPTANCVVALAIVNVDSRETAPPTIAPSVLTFVPGTHSDVQTATVTGAQDNIADGDLGFAVDFTITGCGVPALTAKPALITGVTGNDDTAGVTSTLPGGSTSTEAGGTFEINCKLDSEPLAPVTISAVPVVLTTPFTRTEAVSQTAITFSTANWNTNRALTVTGLDDDYVDGNVAYNVGLSVQSNDPVYQGLTVTAVGATNTDNDQVGVTVSALSRRPEEGGVSGKITVELTSRPTEDVKVTLTNNDATKGAITAPATSELTFQSSLWNVPQTIIVEAVDDEIDDDTATWSISYAVSAPANEVTGYNPGSGIVITDSAVWNIDDDDAAVNVMVGADGPTTSEAAGSTTVICELATEPRMPVTITALALDAAAPVRAEGHVSSNDKLTFDSSNWETAQSWVLTGVDDDYADGDTGYVVQFTPSSGDAVYNSVTIPDVMLTNIDDPTDTAQVVLTSLTQQPHEGALVTGQYSIKLNTKPTADVTIVNTNQDPDEGSFSPTAPIVFSGTNWDHPVIVTVSAKDEDIDDTGVPWKITAASEAPLETTGYNNIAIQDVDVININDDVASVIAATPGGVHTDEAGATIVDVTLKLATEPVFPVVIDIVAQDVMVPAVRAEGTVSPARYTFTDADWDQEKTVQVTGVNDAYDDDDTEYTISFSVTGDAKYQGLSVNDVTLTNRDDADTAGVTVSALMGTPEEANNIAHRGTFTTVLTSMPTVPVTIDLSSSNTAEGVLVSAPRLVFTSANWQVPQETTVAAVNDNIDDDGATWTVVTTASAGGEGTGYDGIAVADVVVTNVDDDEANVIMAAPGGQTTSEDGGSFILQVYLTTQPTADVVVAITAQATMSGATEGTTNGATLTFNAANYGSIQIATVTGLDDPDVDGPQTYVVDVQVMSADANYHGFSTMITATNNDNDVAGIIVTPVVGMPAEAQPTTQRAYVTVVLESRPTSPVTVQPTSSDTNEGTVSLATPQVVFTHGDWGTPKTIYFEAVDDDVDDDGAKWSVTFNVDAPGESSGYDMYALSFVEVENIDDDVSGAVGTASGSTTQEGAIAQTVKYSFFLKTEPLGDVTVSLVSPDPSEVTVTSPAAITFTTANWAIPASFELLGVQDDIDDGDVPVVFQPTVQSSADIKYNTLPTLPAVTITNLDDGDQAGVLLTPAPVVGTPILRVSESGVTPDSFTVALTSEPLTDVVIDVSSSNVNVASVSPSQVLFSPTGPHWSIPQVVTVTPVDDNVADGDRPFSIDFAKAVSTGDSKYDRMAIQQYNAIRLDDDTAGVIVTQSPQGPATTVGEAGLTNASYTLRLNSEPVTPVTISMTPSNTNEGQIRSLSSITFTASDWSVPKEVVVAGMNDDLVDGTQLWRVTHSVRTTDVQYASVAVADVAFSTEDDDSYGFTIEYPDGAAPVAVLEGASNSFGLRLNSQPMAVVDVAMQATNVAACTLKTSTLRFTPSDYATPKHVLVEGVDDNVATAPRSCVVTASPASSTDGNYQGINVGAVDFVVNEDDVVGVVLTLRAGALTEAGGSAQYNVVLGAKPSAPVDVEVFSADASEGIVGTGRVSLNFTNQTWDIPQVVNITGVDDFIDDDVMTFDVAADYTAPGETSTPSYDGRRDIVAATLSTQDDDVGSVVVGGIAADTKEDGSTVEFTVAITTEPVGDVVMTATSSNEAEGVPLPESTATTFTQLNWKDAQTVTVRGVDDMLDDGDIAYTIDLAVSAPAEDPDAPVYHGYTAKRTVIVNEDDDGIGVVFANSTQNTSEASGKATFHFRIETLPGADVNVTFAVSDEEEVRMDAKHFIFTVADWFIPRTATLTGLDDNVADGDVVVMVQATTASTDAKYDQVPVHPVYITNLDDEEAGAVVRHAGDKLLTYEAGHGDASFTVALKSQPIDLATVVVTMTGDAREGKLDPPALTFTQANWNVEQRVAVTGVDDGGVDDGDVEYTITGTLTGDGLSTSEYRNAVFDEVTVVNQNDDHAGIVVSPLQGDATEDGGTATFTIKLGAKPSSPVTVPVLSSDEGEAVLSPSAVEFTPANWNQPRTISVSGRDDGEDDGDGLFAIQVGPATSDDAVYNGVSPAAGNVNARNVGKVEDDDDIPWLWIAVGIGGLVLLVLVCGLICLCMGKKEKTDSFSPEEREMNNMAPSSHDVAKSYADSHAASYRAMEDPPAPTPALPVFQDPFYDDPLSSPHGSPVYSNHPAHQAVDPLAPPSYAQSAYAPSAYAQSAYVSVQPFASLRTGQPAYAQGYGGPGPIEEPRTADWTPIPHSSKNPNGLVRIPQQR